MLTNVGVALFLTSKAEQLKVLSFKKHLASHVRFPHLLLHCGFNFFFVDE